MSMKTAEKIKYNPEPSFTWRMPEKMYSLHDLEEICDTCDSAKDREIDRLKADNAKLKKLVEFLRSEARALELKTALTEKAVPLSAMVGEFTSTPEGRKAWEGAWREQFDEWRELVRQGKMSRIKYYRLINGMDQAGLAEKLGIAQPNVSRLEKPGYNVPAKTLQKLAAIFGVTMEELIGS
jgi:DNA-binding XRE family transcriptional regulator